jgi:murein tripeptide amidase MpaA
LYDHLGLFAWTVELWSPQRQAGIAEYKFIEWWREHPLADDLKMLQWSDDVLGGQGYVDWYPFDHPQLGQIELGGWNEVYAYYNPPPEFLEREIAPFPDWLVWHLLISPRLEVYEARVTPLGEDAYHIRLVIQNTGWLPTYVTKKAVEKKAVRGVVCEIALPPGATLESGDPRQELGQLEGRAYKPAALEAADATDDRAKVEWVVRAAGGGPVTLTARHERAGVVVVEMALADGARTRAKT